MEPAAASPVQSFQPPAVSSPQPAAAAAATSPAPVDPKLYQRPMQAPMGEYPAPFPPAAQHFPTEVNRRLGQWTRTPRRPVTSRKPQFHFLVSVGHQKPKSNIPFVQPAPFRPLASTPRSRPRAPTTPTPRSALVARSRPRVPGRARPPDRRAGRPLPRLPRRVPGLGARRDPFPAPSAPLERRGPRVAGRRGPRARRRPPSKNGRYFLSKPRPPPVRRRGGGLRREGRGAL